MTKINSKDLLKKVRDKEKPDRTNFTFRFSTEIMSAFKTVCKKQNVTPTAVLEEFMQSFIKDMKG